MPKLNGLKGNFLYYFGIDPGVETGLALWGKVEKKFIGVGSFRIHEAMKLIEKRYDPTESESVLVRVEDARLRKWIPRMPNITGELGRREGAGSIKRDAKIWEDFLQDLGVTYELVPPKNNKTKIKAEYFKSLTGYQGETNEHSRDACMLVYGY